MPPAVQRAAALEALVTQPCMQRPRSPLGCPSSRARRCRCPAGERVESLRYYELLQKDVIRLGQSTREYVLLHDTSGADD